MGETGQRRSYDGDGIRVHWEPAKCIHTARCLQALPQVFDVRRRPWVDVHAAGADAIAGAVERCPTGALRYERLDGAPGEQPRRPTVVIAIENGPLMVLGDLDVRDADGRPITREHRLTLCRCGKSRNQPFCDNSHLEAMWQSGPAHEPERPLRPAEPGAAAAPTTVTAQADASLALRGHVRVYGPDGTPLADGAKATLCRCGHSRRKPFCDGSHERAGFRSAAPRLARDRLEAETPAAFERNPRVPDPAAADGAAGGTA